MDRVYLIIESPGEALSLGECYDEIERLAKYFEERELNVFKKGNGAETFPYGTDFRDDILHELTESGNIILLCGGNVGGCLLQTFDLFVGFSSTRYMCEKTPDELTFHIPLRACFDGERTYETALSDLIETFKISYPYSRMVPKEENKKIVFRPRYRIYLDGKCIRQVLPILPFEIEVRGSVIPFNVEDGKAPSGTDFFSVNIHLHTSSVESLLEEILP